MSTNFDAPKSYDLPNQTEKGENNISKLPSNIKEQVTQKTVDDIDKLKQNMQKISHEKFLAVVSFSDRLKHITDPNVNSSELAKNSKVEFNFSFTSEEINPILFQRTTAGQVLPVAVKIVTTQDGKIYSRTSEKGEFFAEDGKRLKIYDKTQITIGELRDTGDYEKIEVDKKQMLENVTVKASDKKLIDKGLEKGINPELVLKVFAAFFGTSNVLEVKPGEYEDFLTQVDRHIGKMNVNEKRADKNNLSQESQDELIARMGMPNIQESLTHNYHEYGELSILSNELGIRNPEFLYAFWSVESTCGDYTNERFEAHLNTSSIGMFQILMTNLTSHPDLVRDLRKDPTNKALNYQALKIFLSDNPRIVAAINNYDIHTVSSLYNGPNYKQGGYHIKLQKALNQYNLYKNSDNLSMAA